MPSVTVLTNERLFSSSRCAVLHACPSFHPNRLMFFVFLCRFESITRIPPYRNRCWLACCAVLLVVIAVTVTARVIILVRSSRGVATPATTPSAEDTNSLGASEGAALPEVSVLFPFVGIDRSSVAGRESRVFGYEKGGGFPAVDVSPRLREDEGARHINRSVGSHQSGTTATLSVSRAALQVGSRSTITGSAGVRSS